MKAKIISEFKEGKKEILLAAIIGFLGYSISIITKMPVMDPLLVSMVIGIIIRAAIESKSKISFRSSIAPRVLIPIGVVFYAVKNLNFIKFAQVESNMMILLIFILLAYFGIILFLGKIFNLKNEITYLTATGSAICGASAITITSPVVEASEDDISISLLSVAIAAFVGLFIFFPFISILFNITDKTYGILSGSVLQFTGFVKAAVNDIPPLINEMPHKDIVSLALSLKAVRYLGLLIAIPVFGSLKKKKFYIPWVLWVFLCSGILGSWIYAVDKTFYSNVLIPMIKPIYTILWSIAMAAVGLTADVKKMLSNNGTKALLIAFLGFFAAIAVFFIGLRVIVIWG